MVTETSTNVLDLVHKIFVFNHETIGAVKQFAAGHYEWSWMVLMLGALLLWNFKCWSIFRTERQKASPSVLRAVGEGTLHWSLSNAALFAAIELHKTVYKHFTEYIPMSDSEFDSRFGFRDAMVGALRKIHLMNKRMTLVPHIMNPHVPFGIMMAVSLVTLTLAFLVTKSDTSNSEDRSTGGDNGTHDVRIGDGWN